MSNQYSYSGSGMLTLGAGIQQLPTELATLAVKATIDFSITPANGGHIVVVRRHPHEPDIHIIADGTDFDRELGKIISYSMLKNTENKAT